MNREPEFEKLLTPAQVGQIFSVDPKTVTRWAKQGRLTFILTLGGHRRYREAEVRGLLAGIPNPQQDAGRCPACSYMYTAPGHRDKCASAS